MDRSDALSVLSKDVPGCTVFTHAKIPDISYDDIVSNRRLCEANLCHHYDTSCTCPPRCGSERYCIDKISSYKDADILKRTIAVDIKDSKELEKVASDFQRLCRKIMIGCRESGLDVFVLADGPCNHCDRCAALDGGSCRCPDMAIPSASGYGVNMERYLKGVNETFSFRDDMVTFYGIFLFR